MTITQEEVDAVHRKSKSQLSQDMFVLAECGFKRDGYFVEFGATNGFDLSNTYMLEKEFNWNGILAEPAIVWHPDLVANRSSHISFDCVWSSSNQSIEFNQAGEAELSTIDSFTDLDRHAGARANGQRYRVNTISLNDLLAKFNAPTNIDYLSIDTEGSEFEILNAFDFNKYNIKVITCEHNYTSMRESIYELLTSKGYVRKYEETSCFDDWYVKA